MTKRTVGTYGLHKSDSGVWFLHQATTNKARPNANAFVSVYSNPDINQRGGDIESPFNLNRQDGVGVGCPHQIDIFDQVNVDWDHLRKTYPVLTYYDLIKVMLPLPSKQKVFYIPYGGSIPCLKKLLRLCSPVKTEMELIGTARNRDRMTMLSASNIMPYVFTGATIKNVKAFDELVQMAMGMERKVIILGERNLIPPPGVHVLDEDWDYLEKHLEELGDIPFERIGASVLHEYMKGTLHENYISLVGSSG